MKFHIQVDRLSNAMECQIASEDEIIIVYCLNQACGAVGSLGIGFNIQPVVTVARIRWLWLFMVAF